VARDSRYWTIQGNLDIGRPRYAARMASTLNKALAVVVAAGFFMMIIMPLASLGIWLTGLAIAFILVPAIVFLAMSWSKSKAEEDGKGMLEEGGLTPEEWTEPTDPDDFEGELD
jgi:hypothetical protein